MAAAYPGAIKSFTPPVVQDAVDTVYAAHINDLRYEVVAVESELGTGLKSSSWSVGNTAFTTATSSWPTLAQRLVNIENGLVTTNDVHTQYVKRAGDSLTGNLAMGGAILTNLGNGSATTDSLRYDQVLASSTTLISGLFSASTPTRDAYTGSAGTSAQPARADHVHPTSTPIGSVTAYAGPTAPTGWLLCNGQVVSRTTYAALFSVIGTTYNIGGEAGTDFRIPDLRGRVAAGLDNMGGSDAGRLDWQNVLGTVGTTSTSVDSGEQNHRLTALESGVAAHSHPITDPGHFHTLYQPTGTGGASLPSRIALDSQEPSYASTMASTTGISVNNATPQQASQEHNNMQPTILLNYIIKAS